MGAKSKSKSKKGPKGKKARAKAKLEQVWGEIVDEDARRASRTRVGKGRVNKGDSAVGVVAVGEAADPLSSRRRGVASTFDKFLERKERAEEEKYRGGSMGRQRSSHRKRKDELERYDSSDNSSGDQSAGESKNGVNGGSLATLLKRISGPKKSSTRMAVGSDDDLDGSDDIAESDSETSSSSDSEGIKTSDDDDMENASDDSPSEGEEDETVSKDRTETKTAAAEDPYEAHFSKPALPQLDSLRSTHVVPHAGNNRKVTTSSLLNSTMDVQMSGPLLDSWDNIVSNVDSTVPDGKSPKKKQDNLHARMAWEEFSAGPHQHVRQVLARNWKSVNKPALKRGVRNGGGGSDGSAGRAFSSLQLAVYPALARYADVMISTETRQNRSEIHHLLSLHILNHVLTSRTRVQRHNRRIKDLASPDEKSKDEKRPEGEDVGSDKWRDQGYTRPKVLVLLPTRGTCCTFVRGMMRLLGDAAIVDNEERFDKEYGPVELGGGDDEEDADAQVRRALVLKQKGSEWNDLFGDCVNNDDDFKMGVSLTPNVVKSVGKKRSKYAGGNSGASGVNVKLFAEFYRSDIILASPIGLRMATTGKGDDDGDEEETDADVDFLSSIDICLVARSDVLLMQNWDHVNNLLDSLNRQPKKVSDVDFSRVRSYFLEGQGARWRQLIVVSKFTDPYILSTFRRHAKNIEGQLKIRQKVPADDASVCDVMARVKQVFQRVACLAVSEAGAERLRYFSDHVLPKLIRLRQRHTLIYIPSYFDFVAVRNMLLKREANFVSVTEYSRVSEVSRGRARFLQGRKEIMLYTGRAHFFLRHKIKGARHVFFFGLPECAEFYPAIVNMLNEGLSDIEDSDKDISRMPTSCLSLFTKFDAHQLERIVGTSHAERMIKGIKNSFMFCP